ncbi:hypothetical protein [Phaeobacter sp. B1627]|uniref:hypothetical protein n=1 Tax=Phaeobacter sp. B1627 TaxID=2583809 RepID=UPI001118515E|nr:hypothetical protein [Phaeobacter sp. B1627]TNJ43911.1 hypothetical protein FGE21_08020 [Phaeobacter sp. B1627]
METTLWDSASLSAFVYSVTKNFGVVLAPTPAGLEGRLLRRFDCPLLFVQSLKALDKLTQVACGHAMVSALFVFGHIHGVAASAI